MSFDSKEYYVIIEKDEYTGYYKNVPGLILKPFVSFLNGDVYKEIENKRNEWTEKATGKYITEKCRYKLESIKLFHIKNKEVICKECDIQLEKYEVSNYGVIDIKGSNLFIGSYRWK